MGEERRGGKRGGEKGGRRKQRDAKLSKGFISSTAGDERSSVIKSAKSLHVSR